ncbi:MAG: riboflavin kinase, partial [Planctomycetota bacterium]
NLDLEGASTPPGGVYFAEARVLGREGSEPAPLERRRVEIPAEAGAGPSFGAVANLGVRPTFQRGVPAGTAASLEVHLVGAEGDLYGSFVEVSFLERHRPELRFGDPESLKAQIRADLDAYRAFRARRAAPDAVSRKDT